MNFTEIENYIEILVQEEEKFKNQSLGNITKDKTKRHRFLFRLFDRFLFFFRSILDFIHLLFLLYFRYDEQIKNKKIVFTAKNFCTYSNGKYFDRIVRPLYTSNLLFINTSKEYYLNRINEEKTFNLGGLVRFICIFFIHDSARMRIFKAYTIINNLVLKKLMSAELIILWFYDINSLSLIFSKYREGNILIEVQHGSIINYPPYVKPSPIKIVDVFYVKNKLTMNYLSNHLCINFQPEYRLIPYPTRPREFKPGTHLFYASTIEFKGLHPVLIKFLSEADFSDLDLTIRLHPRERDNEKLFTAQLCQFNVQYQFDHSENWLLGNETTNIIVISPWSSTIEDAYDNGFETIIIDPVGRDRYQHLIDNKICFYSDDLRVTISQMSTRSNLL